MKRITLFAVGAFLLLSGVFAADGHSVSVHKSIGKISEFNFLRQKQTTGKNSAVRRKTSRFAGRWNGTLYQPNGTLRSKFAFTMRLYQKGRKISGYSWISIIDSFQYYGVMRLRGTVRKKRLSFSEIKVTRENPEANSYWCIKSGNMKLAYVKGKRTLKGNWNAPSCSPGTIVLRKVSAK
jgi:hypothetical protein